MYEDTYVDMLLFVAGDVNRYQNAVYFEIVPALRKLD
jgi:hypothetical protein